jgi:hypothetical protein
VVKLKIKIRSLTPLFVRERVCWRPQATLITSIFKAGNKLICCGQLYLDMVGPVPGCKRGDLEESICKGKGILAVTQDTNYLELQA